jgi:2-oxo-4-hydroxy-4-carboxy--5-ureidoimidazoline (OHCU) decarboxylase
MTVWWEAFIIGCVASVALGFIWIVVLLSRLNGGGGGKKQKGSGSLQDAAVEEVSHLFNDQFREELRNHGRLYFEKIINENAMFLKQDLDITTAQLNEYLKKEITRKLSEEFEAYDKAMQDAQQLALGSLQKSVSDVEAQRAAMTEALEKDLKGREAAMLKVYEDNMAKIIEHYILQTLGDLIDLKSQMPYIISMMEENKQKIMEDMRL